MGGQGCGYFLELSVRVPGLQIANSTSVVSKGETTKETFFFLICEFYPLFHNQKVWNTMKYIYYLYLNTMVFKAWKLLGLHKH